MVARIALTFAIAGAIAGCGGSSRYGDGNPIAGYTDCDILQAEGSTLCDDVYDAQARPRP